MSIPAFKCVVFGQNSGRCDSGNARASITDDGNAIAVLFDKMKVEAGTKARGHDRMCCNLTFKLASPLEAAAEVRLELGGAIVMVGKGTASAFIVIRGHRQALGLDRAVPETSTFVTTLPKGAKKLDVSIVASAKGKYPQSSAMVEVDSVDAIIRPK